MINIINRNILEAEEKIICQQTNCLGIMGAGLALQIARKYPEVDKKYRNFCIEYGEWDFLGQIQLVNTNDGKIIANCFGQKRPGFGKQTDYKALKNCLEAVKNFATQNNFSVAIPYKIGCGLGGGDWNEVYGIIKEIFEDSNIKCVIYQLENVQ